MMELSDEDIETVEILFYEAIEEFPIDDREAARLWMAHAKAAINIVKSLQNGVMP
jgi:hypothetical protein